MWGNRKYARRRALFSTGDLEQLAFGEVADEAEIGGEKVVFREVAEVDPADFVVDVALDFAGEFADDKKLQVDGAAMTVVVADAGNGGADDAMDAQFFVELAGEGLLGTFAGLDFAAGKLPFEGHNLVGAALADKHLIIANDERGGDKAQGWTGLVGLRAALGDVH